MGIPGKPDGISGSDVESYFLEGKIQEIAAYCESDVINTYRVWLRHELFRGRLDQSKYEESELRLSDFLDSRKAGVNLPDSSGAQGNLDFPPIDETHGNE
jgi:predicted PolB exonuclease-like 3'-5' exonuclease